MLSPEQVQKMRAEAGIPPEGYGAVNKSAQDAHTAQQRIAALESSAASMKATEAAKPTYGKNKDLVTKGTDINPLGEAYNNNVQGFKDTVQEGADRLNSTDNPIKKVGIAAETGLRTAAKGVETLFQPLTTATQGMVSSLADHISNNPTIQKIAQTHGVSAALDAASGTGDAYTTWAKEHPNASKDVESGIQVALALTGGEELNKPVSEAFSDAVKGAVDTGKKIAKPLQAGAEFVTDQASKIDPRLGGSAFDNTVSKLDATSFDNGISEAQKIQNPSGKYSPKEIEQAYREGNVETKGNGLFKRDVVTPKPTSQDEALSELVNEGRISSSNTPSENIQTIRQEARRFDANIDDIVNRPELNKPFTEATINKNLKEVNNSAKDKYLFTSGSSEEKAYDTVLETFKKTLKENPFNNSGLRKTIKAFNSKMEQALGTRVYDENIQNVRVQAAKDVRSAANNFLADNLESPPIKANKELANSKVVNTLPSKSQYEMGKAEGGSIYRQQLRREAQLLNAADDIAYKARTGIVGKTKLQQKATGFAKKHPYATSAILGGSAAEVVRKVTGL